MTRNLKALGLALMAVFAMSATMATGASAQQGKLTTKNGNNITGIGTEIEGKPNSFTAFGQTVECPGAIYTIHKYNVTPHTFVEPGATTFTVTPHYEPKTETEKNCKTASGLFVTVTMNGCDFVFHLGETTDEKEGTYGVTADLVCPENKEVTLDIYTGTGEGIKVCEVHIPGSPKNQGLKGAHATNNGDHIDINGTFKEIHATRTAGLCGGERTTGETRPEPHEVVPFGEYHVNVTIEAKNEEGEAEPISISH